MSTTKLNWVRAPQRTVIECDFLPALGLAVGFLVGSGARSFSFPFLEPVSDVGCSFSFPFLERASLVCVTAPLGPDPSGCSPSTVSGCPRARAKRGVGSLFLTVGFKTVGDLITSSSSSADEELDELL